MITSPGWLQLAVSCTLSIVGIIYNWHVFFGRAAVKGSKERFNSMTRLIIWGYTFNFFLLLAAVVSRLEERDGDAATYLIVAAVNTLLVHLMTKDDDNWFNHQWKKLKSKWKSLKARVKSFRWNPGAKPKFT